MPFKKTYTPFGAIGELATKSGKAQQAVREQSYTKQEESQARGIEAQQQLQATQIAASREEWQRKLIAQQEQFATGTALSKEQMYRQQQVAEMSAIFQRKTQEAQLEQQQQQFQENLAINQQKLLADIRAQANTFQLQQAQEARIFQNMQQQLQTQQQTQMIQQEKWDFEKQQSGNSLQFQQQWLDRIDASNLSPNQKMQAQYNIMRNAGGIPTGVTPPRPQDVKPWGRLDLADFGDKLGAAIPDPWGTPGPEDIAQAVKSIKALRNTAAYDVLDPAVQGQLDAVTAMKLSMAGYDNTTVASQLDISPESIKKKMASSGKEGVYSESSLDKLVQLTANLRNVPQE